MNSNRLITLCFTLCFFIAVVLIANGVVIMGGNPVPEVSAGVSSGDLSTATNDLNTAIQADITAATNQVFIDGTNAAATDAATKYYKKAGDTLTGNMDGGGQGATNFAAIEATSYSNAAGQRVTEFSSDGTLADNSDAALPTEKAVKTYVDANAGAAAWTETANGMYPNNLSQYVVVSNFTSAGISNALDLAGASGKDVYIPPGTYTMTAGIKLTNSNMRLCGGGMGTIWDGSAWTPDAPMLDINGQDGVTIANFRMNGQKGAGQAFALVHDGNSQVDNFTFTRMFLYQSDARGLWLQNNASENVKITDSRFEDNDDHSIETESDFITLSRCFFKGDDLTSVEIGNDYNVVQGCIFHTGVRHGLLFSGGHWNTVANCVFYSNSRNGISAGGGTQMTISGCTFDSCGYAAILGINDSTVVGCTFENGGNTYADIELTGVHRNTIQGNVFVSSAGNSEWAVELDNSDDNIISGNRSAGHDSGFMYSDADDTGNIIVDNRVADTVFNSGSFSSSYAEEIDASNNAKDFNGATLSNAVLGAGVSLGANLDGGGNKITNQTAIGAAAYMGAAQNNITDATETIVQFNTEVFDSEGEYNTTTYRYTPSMLGKYFIAPSFSVDTVDDAKHAQCAIRHVNILGDGATNSIGFDRAHSSVADGTVSLEPTATYNHTNAGDQVYITVTHNNGDNTPDIASSARNQFSIYYKGQ